MSYIKKIIVLLALVILVGGVSIGYFYNKKNNASESNMSQIFTPPQEIIKFSLIDSQGRPFNKNSFWGHWTFIFFGVTNCMQNCPSSMSSLKQMYQILLDQKHNPMPQVVFISIDPEQDTMQKIGNYVQLFNPNFQGATGDKAELDKLVSSVSGVNPKDKNRTVFLIDPAGKLAARFSLPDPKVMASDFQLIVANSG
jgi:protein SCO1/2